MNNEAGEQQEATTMITSVSINEGREQEIVTVDTAANNEGRGISLHEFFVHFCKARGARAILAVTLCVAVGMGATVGVIPEAAEDKYARLHGYDGPTCASLVIKPPACLQGADDAQSTASYGNLVLCFIALFINPLVGSYSDRHGRRIMIIVSVLAMLLPAVAFVCLLQFASFPVWAFYLAYSLGLAINFNGLVFASFADVLPSSIRAQGNGVFMATFYAGYCVSPSLPLVLDHFGTAVASVAALTVGSIIALFALPETHETVPIDGGSIGPTEMYDERIPRPWKEMAILVQNWRLVLLAGTSFLVNMVYMGDHTLVLYYVEERLNVGDSDVSRLFLLLGVAGLFLSGVAIQPLIRCLGERGLLFVSLLCGTLHNTLYGLARDKMTIYAAFTAAQFTKLNTPVLSAMASHVVTGEEQGRIQGALAAVNAIGSAVGPLSMELIYHKTENNPHFGPGCMFFFGGMLYGIGGLLVALIPPNDAATSNTPSDSPDSENLIQNELQEPLLAQGSSGPVEP